MNVGGTPANLRPPFERGNTAPRRSGDVDRAIRLARKHSPEAIQTAIKCMRDPTASWSDRLKAVQVVVQVGLPKDRDAIDIALDENHGPRYLNVRFVSPDGSISDTPNFDGAERPHGEARRQAGGDVAKIVDEQPINDRRLVTPQRLPAPRMVHDAGQETPTLPAQAPRQDELILARPNGKIPSWRARNAAGIFR
jgi:hypothetical protein